MRLRLFAENIDDGSQRLSRLDSPDPFTVLSDNPGVTDLERYQISLHSRKRFDAGTLETIHGFQTWELNPSTVDLDLVMQSSDGGSEVTTLTGYPQAPVQVLRNGVPTSAWTWSATGQTVTLTETSGGAGATWRVRP